MTLFVISIYSQNNLIRELLLLLSLLHKWRKIVTPNYILCIYWNSLWIYVWPYRRQPTRLHRPWDSPGKNTGVGCHFLLQCMKVKSDPKINSGGILWPFEDTSKREKEYLSPNMHASSWGGTEWCSHSINQYPLAVNLLPWFLHFCCWFCCWKWPQAQCQNAI